jgi:prepilin peptidase CpaA
MLEILVLTVFPGAVAFAGAMDLFTMKIPNRISIALVLAFLLVAPLAGLGPWDIVQHIGAGLIVLAITFGMFMAGWFGGGDAKLLSVIALWLGLDLLPEYLMAVALVGGLLALLFGAFRSAPLPLSFMCQDWAVRLHDKKTGIPYGIALAAGALLVYPQTPYFAAMFG